MSKKNNDLGRAMIKARLAGKHPHKRDTWIHTSELQDGTDWNRINFTSVTEQNSLDEFLSTAELAGTDFEAERLNVHFVSHQSIGILTKDDKAKITELHDKHRELLRIPRRPLWKDNTELASDAFKLKERDAFLVWRRKLADLQNVEHLAMTPFEKNIEFWKQLWRVVEKSDVIVQIVDARNPLLFRCDDVDKYVKEVDENKMNVLLINKADYLSERQRLEWLRYFEKINVKVIFWSAKIANEADKAEEAIKEENEDVEEEGEEGESEDEDDDEETEEGSLSKTEDEATYGLNKSEILQEKLEENAQAMESLNLDIETSEKCKIYTRDELIQYFKTIHQDLARIKPGCTTVGMVGYPNVGKSSTINALLQSKKVAVSETPGKTKHYQTLYIDEELMLCDCPGLVFPSFVATRGELILNGILPVDQMRDHIEPINIMAHQIPGRVIEIEYGIMLPKPTSDEDQTRLATASELCSTYAYAHGYMNHKGMPDEQRSARCLIKDYINGKLIYCYPPPGVDEQSFQEIKINKHKEDRLAERRKKIEAHLQDNSNLSSFDREFFQKLEPRAIQKPSVHGQGYSRIKDVNGNQALEGGLKGSKKHFKANKREKVRRITTHLNN